MDASWQAPPLSLWASSQGKWGGEDEEDARGGKGATIARPTNRVPATERRHGAVAYARMLAVNARYVCVHTNGFTADVNSRTLSGLEWRAGDIACGTRLSACRAQPFRLSSCCCERRGSRPRARVWEPSREQPAVSLN